MSKNSDHVKKWRRVSKARMVEAMGGKCVCCGYNACNEALDFHHIDPNEKDFAMGKIMANPKSWKFIVRELRKCVLVCANCHREIEAGVKQLPASYATFDESYSTYRELRSPKPKHCKHCKNIFETFSKSQRFCSQECAKISRRVVNRPSKEELEHYIAELSWSAIGRMYHVSDNAVRKWARSYGLM